MVCERCKHDARFVERRPNTYTSLVGSIRLDRCYYHCRACVRGHLPWVQELGLTDNSLTPAAAEITCIAGVQTSFSKASDVTLRKLIGLRLSESTVERTTESTGERLDGLLKDRVRLGEPCAWKWQRDACGRKCGYVSLDATGVRQQGPRGARAEGRMAYVGMIYNSQSEHDDDHPPTHQVRYLAGYYDLDTLGAELRRQADHVGWNDVGRNDHPNLPTIMTPTLLSFGWLKPLGSGWRGRWPLRNVTGDAGRSCVFFGRPAFGLIWSESLPRGATPPKPPRRCRNGQGAGMDRCGNGLLEEPAAAVGRLDFGLGQRGWLIALALYAGGLAIALLATGDVWAAAATRFCRQERCAAGGRFFGIIRNIGILFPDCRNDMVDTIHTTRTHSLCVP